MGRDALGLIAPAVLTLTMAGCPREPDGPPRMGDARVLEVAQSCARRDHAGRGAGGCRLLLDEATLDEGTVADGSHVFRVEFTEERCGKPRYKSGLVLQIDDAGACRRVGP